MQRAPAIHAACLAFRTQNIVGTATAVASLRTATLPCALDICHSSSGTYAQTIGTYAQTTGTYGETIGTYGDTIGTYAQTILSTMRGL